MHVCQRLSITLVDWCICREEDDVDEAAAAEGPTNENDRGPGTILIALNSELETLFVTRAFFQAPAPWDNLD